MNFTELQLQIKKLEPTLSAESLMLVNLFMPFYEVLVKENTKLKVKVKNQHDKLAINSKNSSKPSSKDEFKASKDRSLRKKSGKKPGA